MEQRVLGRTGLRVSAIGFGCGNIGGLLVRGTEAAQRDAIATALAAGINYFDTAAQYGNGLSETHLGRALRALGAEPLVGTKVRLTPAQLADLPGALRAALEASLRRLGRDHVDLFQLHNAIAAESDPGRGVLDVATVCGPVAEGLRALQAAGLTRYIGCTGLGDPAALHQVVASGAFDTIQCYFNALNPSAGYSGHAPTDAQDFAGLIDRAAAVGLGVLAIRVLAAGALAATPERHALAGAPGAPLTAGGDYARDLARAARLRQLATELGLEGPLELALRFALAQPRVSVALVGFSDTAQVAAAVRWAERGPLPAEAVARVLALATG
ncbi:MAG TPA: aldo/keto reductase [Chloroflexota bacterium]|nr:aldo/keto reductase [Chloroflexota bacterium]